MHHQDSSSVNEKQEDIPKAGSCSSGKIKKNENAKRRKYIEREIELASAVMRDHVEPNLAVRHALLIIDHNECMRLHELKYEREEKKKESRLRRANRRKLWSALEKKEKNGSTRITRKTKNSGLNE